MVGIIFRLLKDKIRFAIFFARSREVLVRASGLSALVVAVLCWVCRAVLDNAVVFLHCGKDKIRSAIFAARSCEVLVRASCRCALLVAAVRCVCVGSCLTVQ